MEKFDRLYGGIVAVQSAFYEEYSLQTLTRMILCVGMLESTGDPFLNYPDGQSQGFMQVSPASVVADYNAYGQIISSPSVSLVPDAVDVTDPGTSVMLWGWYGNIAAHTGVSIAEYVNRVEWNKDAHRRRPNLGHAILAWYAGPSADLSNEKIKRNFQDYLDRLSDYWVGSGFGSQGQLYHLLRRRLQGNVTHVTERPDFIDTL
jgi:hypothetical protein